MLKTQTTIALSSGEAELHGINSGITQGLGLQSIAKDLGFDVKVRVHSDATAALIICRRRGLGKTRHVQIKFLWLQQAVFQKRVEIRKIKGTENPGEILTKYLSFADMQTVVEKIWILIRSTSTS